MSIRSTRLLLLMLLHVTYWFIADGDIWNRNRFPSDCHYSNPHCPLMPRCVFRRRYSSKCQDTNKSHPGSVIRNQDKWWNWQRPNVGTRVTTDCYIYTRSGWGTAIKSDPKIIIIPSINAREATDHPIQAQDLSIQIGAQNHHRPHPLPLQLNRMSNSEWPHCMHSCCSEWLAGQMDHGIRCDGWGTRRD